MRDAIGSLIISIISLGLIIAIMIADREAAMLYYPIMLLIVGTGANAARDIIKSRRRK